MKNGAGVSENLTQPLCELNESCRLWHRMFMDT